MDSITNYYEKMVLDCIRRALAGTKAAHDDDYIADVACVALNRLPARYVRHIVDTRFFESESDYKTNAESVELAVNHALDYIKQRADESPDGTAHAKPGAGSK
ncbi:hypothetical protein PHACT_10510 [Pseudohongiella acticola]|uniref:Competence protein ComFB n=1 Tax=Pseudohongiella acticola TaxID=1524254 RepID=A0A1E8CM17_9GAMM|nr:late competence development ComFB family protein [Pseudohongiella acticola]OFE13516.1 hypothetical protein PHACT_10510 [Pseudohongiella acticola]